MSALIRFQDVYRDAIQSLFGTNPSADEIIAAYPEAYLTGATAIQTGGGTFFDIFAKKGRNEWEEIEKILTHFKDRGVEQSALIRGDFLFGYEPQPYDVIEAMVFEYAEMGMNVLQNFHGMNDPRCLVGVVKAVKKAQEAGHNIRAQGTICIEDNPNITVESCLEFARELVAMGHEGFYLKSASGVLDPEFTRQLTAALLDEFPDQEIGIHVHSTYGKAPVCYMAAIDEATKRGKTITIDVQNPALAGSTAHPSMLKMAHLIRNHPFQHIKDNLPTLNMAAIKNSLSSLFRMRFIYRNFESSYDPRLLEAMRKARAAGGASATLKNPKLLDQLVKALGTDDWTEIQIKIYEEQAQILEDLGDPTQVTPYAKNTTDMAISNIINDGRYRWIPPGVVDYLVGRHGRVPDTVNPELQAKALKQAELEAPIEYVPSTEREGALPEAERKLIEAGIENPTRRQMISAVLLEGGVQHVVQCHKGENMPQQPPELPFYAQDPAPIEGRLHKYGVPVRDIRDAISAIGGVEKLQEIAERALHLKQLDDHLYDFPEGEGCLETEWWDGNIAKIKQLLDGIETSLKNAGFVGTQILSITDMSRQDNVRACIREVVDTKGTNLYDFMVRAVQDHELGKRWAPKMVPAAQPVMV